LTRLERKEKERKEGKNEREEDLITESDRE
jgi:hypothetical protein